MDEICLKIFIADDNPHASNVLKDMIYQWAAYLDARVDISIFKSVTNDKEFLLQAANSDLVLLDIEMPGLDGISFAKLLRELSSKPAIAYVTSHPDYAIEGYAAQAIAYLVKPITQQQVDSLLSKIVKIMHHSESPKIVFVNKQNRFVVSASEIISIEAHGHSCIVVTRDNSQKFPVSFVELKNELQTPPFLRCHRGFYVNIRHLVRFDTFEFEMINGAIIPIGRSYIQEVKDALMKYMRGSSNE